MSRDYITYDHEDVARRRARGDTWDEIGRACGTTGKRVRQAHGIWCKKRIERGEPPIQVSVMTPEPETREKLITQEEMRRITSLEDLIEFFDVDLEVWDIRDFRVNSWEQHSVEKGITPLYQVRANLIPRVALSEDAGRRVIEEFLADFREAPPHIPNPRALATPKALDPVLAEMAIMDPHFGMLSWGQETGEDQDINTIQEDYLDVVNQQLSLMRIYPIERIIMLIGNDMAHANQSGADGKGGTTKRGTNQDIDTRLAKIFTAMRRCVVSAVDSALDLAPVDIVVVPGNHDPDESYRLGEVLAAWYRENPYVNVDNRPRMRKFYNFGRNTFMYTHGEELKRQRDALPLIMADECPAEWWVASAGGSREIHTGHNHARFQGGYYPTAEMSESRGVITRSLPGLTSVDAWHVQEGYRHQRAATLLLYRSSGGLLGLHEFRPLPRTR